MWWSQHRGVFFFLFNFLVWKKILKYFQKFNKSSQIYTTKTKKLHFFLSKNNKICQKKQNPPLESACEIGWGWRRMCILVTCGHVGSSSIMQSEEPGKISDVQKIRIYYCWSRILYQDNLILLVLGTRLILG